MANATAKIHPATREVLPDDPLQLTGCETPGDPDLMLRLLVEEYARIGWTAESIMRLARDPNYRAFHGLWRLLGDEAMQRRVEGVVSKCGVIRVSQSEAAPPESDSASERHLQLSICDELTPLDLVWQGTGHAHRL